MLLARTSRSRYAFTIVEILVAMAVVAILFTIGLKTMRGTKQRALIGRARGEMAVIAQALEAFKRHYGDYPQTGGFTQATPAPTTPIGTTQAQCLLFNALMGVYSATDFTTQRNGPTLVELSKLAVEETTDYKNRVTTNSLMVPAGTPPAKPRVASCFIDPWGNRYLYYYKPAPLPGRPANSQWALPGYILYSAGPDGQQTAPNMATGLFTGTTQTTGTNADNIYANP
jgi:prepilin-type N-terminal cleavage/methylation domain-containing protein